MSREVKKQGENLMRQHSEIKQEIKDVRRILQEQFQTSSGNLSFSEKLFAFFTDGRTVRES